MPYVFYDTETTGVETAFDQILQFAAIKTDDEFVELVEKEVKLPKSAEELEEFLLNSTWLPSGFDGALLEFQEDRR